MTNKLLLNGHMTISVQSFFLFEFEFDRDSIAEDELRDLENMLSNAVLLQYRTLGNSRADVLIGIHAQLNRRAADDFPVVGIYNSTNCRYTTSVTQYRAFCERFDLKRTNRRRRVSQSKDSAAIRSP